jgi:hypothetical protein
VVALCSAASGTKLILGGNYLGSRTQAAAAAALSYGCVVVV